MNISKENSSQPLRRHYKPYTDNAIATWFNIPVTAEELQNAEDKFNESLEQTEIGMRSFLQSEVCCS